MADDKKKNTWRAELPDLDGDSAEEARLRRKWEREQALKNAQREKRLKEQRRKLRAVVLLAGTAVLVIALLFVLLFKVVLGEPGKYNRANRLLENGSYAEAIVAFREIRTYKDAADKMNEAIGLQAQKLVGRDNVYYATSESAPWLKITERGAISFDEKKYTGDWSDVIIPDVFDGVLVTEIDEKGFAHCEKITGITVSDCIERLGSYAFLGCDGFVSIRLPEHLRQIGESAFEGCTSLKTVTFGNEVEVVYTNAFSDCTSLTTVNLPDSTREIGAYAFSGCTSLTEISIGNGVKKISAYAFSACDKLALLTYRGTVAEWEAVDVNLERAGIGQAKILFSATVH